MKHRPDRAVEKVQRELIRQGHDLIVDGVQGPKTSAAVIDFKKSQRLPARDYVGPLTRAALFEEKKPKRNKGFQEEPAWLRRARQELGVTEIPGQHHNPRVLWYWTKAKLGFDTDEVPWCAGFVCAMLEDVGIRSTRSGMARSFTRWGKKLGKPVVGAVVVYWRGKPDGWSGHVGFVAGLDKSGRILTLGGNQDNQVSIEPFTPHRVLGYYWPEAVPVEDKLIVRVQDDRPSSVNEA